MNIYKQNIFKLRQTARKLRRIVRKCNHRIQHHAADPKMVKVWFDRLSTAEQALQALEATCLDRNIGGPPQKEYLI